MRADVKSPALRPDITGIQGGVVSRDPSKTEGPSTGPSFQDELLKNLNQTGPTGAQGTASPTGLKFSGHAVERMQTRGIHYSQEMLRRIEQAVEKAAQKGAKETLVVTDDSAMIVAVKNNTVVTVMDKANMKENVFTNIDSTVVL